MSTTAELAREVSRNSAVWVFAFGAWRRGIVTDIARTRIKVRYVSNNTTLAERERWFGAGDAPVLDGILAGPVSWPCTPCGYHLHGRPGVTVEQLRNDHNERQHPIPFDPGTGPVLGYVAGRCGHRVAESEWRAGFRVCERCPSEPTAVER